MKRPPKKKTAAIVQARMGSERLPGKVLTRISGVPLLRHIIERLEGIHGLDAIIVATTTQPEDRAIEVYCKEQKVSCFRGEKDDVLKRFIGAAEAFSVDIIVRICADSPLLDGPFLDRMIERHHQSKADLTIASPRTVLGATGEVFSLEALEKSATETDDPRCREHVTPWLRNHTDRYKVGVMEPPDYLRDHPARLTVDTKEDLALIREIYRHFYSPGSLVDLREVLLLLTQKPEWLEINAEIRQRAWND